MAETRRRTEPIKRSHKSQSQGHSLQEPETPRSRGSLRSFFTCKYHQITEGSKKDSKRISCSGSLCSMRDNPRVMQKAEATSPEACKRRVSVSGRSESSRSLKAPLSEINGAVIGPSLSSSSSTSSLGGSFRGIQLRRLSGCYECRMVVDPIDGVTRDSSLRTTICSCPNCGEIFMKSESLELHQAIRHAVSELGPEDTSRNIVEIIFQSSWLKKQAPVCKIDRILKVHNTRKTIARFEEYRDSIKSRASRLAKKHPRCAADGNELLRFHCTSLMCSLGLNGSSNLCDSIPHCKACSFIRDGLKTDELGRICTMATSGRAHDAAQISKGDEKRAMLVCRVIAGRVKKTQDAVEDCDSAAGEAGVYSNFDELFVFNPKAILPCFVVIYRSY